MIFGLVLLIQEKEIDEYCFKLCTLGPTFAGVDGGDNIGPMIPCRQKQCPYEEKKSDVIGQVNGEDFRIRKLKKVEGE